MAVFFRNAVETFENPINMLLVYAFPVVGIFEISDAVRCGTLNMDDNARAGIAEGILHQIPELTLQQS